MYQTTYTVKVLSEEPLPTYMALSEIERQTTLGEYALHSFGAIEEKRVSRKEMTALLYEAGSDPSFFQIENDEQ